MTSANHTPLTAPRILIIRLSALGDILHTLPLLDALRARWPGATIGWLCEPVGAQLLAEHPMIDAIHVVPKKAIKTDFFGALRGPAKELLDSIKAQDYEISIDVQGLTKSAVWARLAKIPRRLGFAGAEARELTPMLNNERVGPRPGSLHVVQKNLDLLQPLGIDPPEPIRFPLHLPEPARRRAAEITGDANADAPLFLFNPGAGWATKIWAPERMGKLAGRLREEYNARVAFCWGPREQPLVEAAIESAGGVADFNAERIPHGPGLYILPATTFIELGAVIARARLFVGGDTGPTHFAAALGVPTVSMMGPLDWRRNGPYGDHCLTVQHAVPRKAPFWANHRRWCDPRTDLRLVSVEEVAAACRRILAQSQQAAPSVPQAD